MFEGGLPAGVKMVLTQLIKAAAPDLAEQVDQIGKLITAFDARLKHCEQMLEKITGVIDHERRRQLETGSGANGRTESKQPAANDIGTENAGG